MKSIPLGFGLKSAMVDDEDYDFLVTFCWYLDCRSGLYYARERDRTLMHRLLTKAPRGLIVHHKDDNGLNNQKNNLAVMTQADHARLPRRWKT